MNPNSGGSLYKDPFASLSLGVVVGPKVNNNTNNNPVLTDGVMILGRGQQPQQQQQRGSGGGSDEDDFGDFASAASSLRPVSVNLASSDEDNEDDFGDFEDAQQFSVTGPWQQGSKPRPGQPQQRPTGNTWNNNASAAIGFGTNSWNNNNSNNNNSQPPWGQNQQQQQQQQMPFHSNSNNHNSNAIGAEYSGYGFPQQQQQQQPHNFAMTNYNSSSLSSSLPFQPTTPTTNNYPQYHHNNSFPMQFPSTGLVHTEFNAGRNISLNVNYSQPPTYPHVSNVPPLFADLPPPLVVPDTQRERVTSALSTDEDDAFAGLGPTDWNPSPTTTTTTTTTANQNDFGNWTESVVVNTIHHHHHPAPRTMPDLFAGPPPSSNPILQPPSVLMAQPDPISQPPLPEPSTADPFDAFAGLELAQTDWAPVPIKTTPSDTVEDNNSPPKNAEISFTQIEGARESSMADQMPTYNGSQPRTPIPCVPIIETVDESHGSTSHGFGDFVEIKEIPPHDNNNKMGEMDHYSNWIEPVIPNVDYSTPPPQKQQQPSLDELVDFTGGAEESNRNDQPASGLVAENATTSNIGTDESKSAGPTLDANGNVGEDGSKDFGGMSFGWGVTTEPKASDDSDDPFAHLQALAAPVMPPILGGLSQTSVAPQFLNKNNLDTEQGEKGDSLLYIPISMEKTMSFVEQHPMPSTQVMEDDDFGDFGSSAVVDPNPGSFQPISTDHGKEAAASENAFVDDDDDDEFGDFESPHGDGRIPEQPMSQDITIDSGNFGFSTMEKPAMDDDFGDFGSPPLDGAAVGNFGFSPKDAIDEPSSKGVVVPVEDDFGDFGGSAQLDGEASPGLALHSGNFGFSPKNTFEEPTSKGVVVPLEGDVGDFGSATLDGGAQHALAGNLGFFSSDVTVEPSSKGSVVPMEDDFGDFGSAQMDGTAPRAPAGNFEFSAKDAIDGPSSKGVVVPMEDDFGDFGTAQLDLSLDSGNYLSPTDAVGIDEPAAMGIVVPEEDDFGDFGSAQFGGGEPHNLSLEEPSSKEVVVVDDFGDFGSAHVDVGTSMPLGAGNFGLPQTDTVGIEEQPSKGVVVPVEDDFGDFGSAQFEVGTENQEHLADGLMKDDVPGFDAEDSHQGAVISVVGLSESGMVEGHMAERLPLGANDLVVDGDFGDFGSAEIDNAPGEQPFSGGADQANDGLMRSDDAQSGMGSRSVSDQLTTSSNGDFGDFGSAAFQADIEGHSTLGGPNDNFGDFGSAKIASDEVGDIDDFGDFDVAPVDGLAGDDKLRDNTKTDMGDSNTANSGSTNLNNDIRGPASFLVEAFANDDGFGDFGSAQPTSVDNVEPEDEKAEPADEKAEPEDEDDDFGDFGSAITEESEPVPGDPEFESEKVTARSFAPIEISSSYERSKVVFEKIFGQTLTDTPPVETEERESPETFISIHSYLESLGEKELDHSLLGGKALSTILVQMSRPSSADDQVLVSIDREWNPFSYRDFRASDPMSPRIQQSNESGQHLPDVLDVKLL